MHSVCHTCHAPRGVFSCRFPLKKLENYATSHGSTIHRFSHFSPSQARRRKKKPSRRKSPREKGKKEGERKEAERGLLRPHFLDHRPTDNLDRCPAPSIEEQATRRPLDAGRGVQREAAADSAVRRRSQWQQLPVPARHRPGTATPTPSRVHTSHVEICTI